MQDKGLIGNTPLVSYPSETPLTYKTDKNRKIFCHQIFVLLS